MAKRGELGNEMREGRDGDVVGYRADLVIQSWNGGKMTKLPTLSGLVKEGTKGYFGYLGLFAQFSKKTRYLT